MSVRIHQLSKQIGLENKELISLLQKRGFPVTSASSTIDNISAESLVNEFKGKQEPDADEATAPKMKTSEKKEAKPAAENKNDADDKPSIQLPPGVFVKSADDVIREREEKAAAAEAAKAPSSRTTAPVPPPIQRAPAAKTPPPPPAPPRPGVKSPPPPPTARPPATPPVARRTPPAPPAPPARTSPSTESPAAKKGEKPEQVAPKSEKPSKVPADETATATATDEEEIKVIVVRPPIVVRDFAGMIGRKPFQLISELMEMGIFASMNQVIEADVANDLAARHGYLLDIRVRGEGTVRGGKAKKKAEPVDETKFLEPRPPVVCILGHVDHGKTTLIDRIRKASVVKGEAGGITQHIGAYQVETESGKKITFLDTPGHAAFSKMRARGATVTDIAILVVAADDGFMPQTDEALKHAQKAGVPVIVAVNKMDARGANLERVQRQMQERQIAPEDWGGETITVPISALKGEGIDDLLEMVALQAEILELKANPRGAASGIVVEAQIEVGRGPTATVIIEKGTLKVGDSLVCGPHYCKVRAMFDDAGKNVKQATPATPVKVTGWSNAPEAGSTFEGVKNERTAKALAEEKEIELKQQPVSDAPTQRPTIDDLFSAIESQKKKTFRVVLRCDVQGSLEAVIEALEEIKSDKVDLEIVAAAVGPIAQSDVLMAQTAEATIIGFGVGLEGGGIRSQAKHHGVEIQTYDVIYQLIDGVKETMGGLLDPEIRESKLGAAEVRQIFPLAKGQVAGCLITEGKIVRDRKVRVIRQGKSIAEGSVSTLKRFKDDVSEVRAGYECGIGIGGFNSYEIGDIIEAFELKKIRATL